MVKNRVKIVDNRAYRINSYGEHNDYPQDVIDISNASPTLTGCISLYKKFVGGNGFLSKETGNLKVNDYETLNDLLIKIVNDMCTFGGFAVHVNYNILYQGRMQSKLILFYHFHIHRIIFPWNIPQNQPPFRILSTDNILHHLILSFLK